MVPEVGCGRLDVDVDEDVDADAMAGRWAADVDSFPGRQQQEQRQQQNA